jgi:putative methyltransferase (TIGR04325 family)
MTAARTRLFVKGLTPPFLWAALKAIKDRRVRAQPPAPQPQAPPPETEAPEVPEWEYVPEGWARADADARVKGWDVDAIVAAYRDRWPSFLRALDGPRPLGIAHEVPEGVEVPNEDEAAHNTVVSFAYVLARAAHGAGRVSVLDWGGGIGHYLLIGRRVVPEVEIDYHCRDVPKLTAYGRQLFPEARFCDDDETCLDRRYDLVFASGSLQYAREWPDALRRLAAATGKYLFVTRLPVAFHAPSFVVVQRPYAYGYETEYLGWVVNRVELLQAAADAGLELEREFLVSARLSAAGAPEDPIGHRGFLFRPGEAPPR